jgi:VWFA-related protein
MSVSPRKHLLQALLPILILVATLAAARPCFSQAPSGGSNMTLIIAVTDDKGRYVGGLPRSAFTITEDRNQLEITSFRSDDGALSIAVLFDTSASMGGLRKEGMAVVKNALADMASQSHPANEYLLMSFSKETQVLMDWTTGAKGFTDALSKLPVSGKASKGTTAFNDACLLALEKLAPRSTQRHVLLVISDGLDTDSRHSFKELRETLKRAETLFYAVAFPSMSSETGALRLEGQAVLNDLASRTGGKAIFPVDMADMYIGFEQVGLELRHQYSVGIKPGIAPGEAGKWHALKVKVAPLRVNGKDVKLFARTREGYYAP